MYIENAEGHLKIFGILYIHVHLLSNLLSTNALFVPYWSMLLQCGTCTHLVTSSSWRVSNVGLPDGSVGVDGILSIGTDLSHLTIV